MMQILSTGFFDKNDPIDWKSTNNDQLRGSAFRQWNEMGFYGIYGEQRYKVNFDRVVFPTFKTEGDKRDLTTRLNVRRERSGS